MSNSLAPYDPSGILNSPFEEGADFSDMLFDDRLEMTAEEEEKEFEKILQERREQAIDMLCKRIVRKVEPILYNLYRTRVDKNMRVMLMEQTKDYTTDQIFHYPRHHVSQVSKELQSILNNEFKKDIIERRKRDLLR